LEIIKKRLKFLRKPADEVGTTSSIFDGGNLLLNFDFSIRGFYEN